MTSASDRQAALAAALRANLKRRKAAGRAGPSAEGAVPGEAPAVDPHDAPPRLQPPPRR